MNKIHWYKIAWSTWAISVVLDIASWLPVFREVRPELLLTAPLLLIPILFYLVAMLVDMYRQLRDTHIRQIVLDVLGDVLSLIQEAEKREEAAKVQIKKEPVKQTKNKQL